MSAQLRTRAGGRRRAGALLIPLIVVLAGCSTAAGTPTPASANPAVAPGASGPASGALGAPDRAPGTPAVGAPPSGGTEVGATGVATSGGGTSSGAGVAGSSTAIAYPYPVYPGSPGLAPDHTIVVTGIGRADVRADLSDRASAQRTALDAAIADAKAQADVVARAAGATITGVLSVSVSSEQPYAVPMPMTPGAVPGATQGVEPNIAPAPVPYEPTQQQLVVAVTIAYRIS